MIVSKIKRFAGAFLLVMGLALAGAATPANAGGGRVKVGEMAPDFTMKLADGTKITRDELRGQVVVLNFWATWCGPCRTELPMLDTYYVIKEKAGLRVFAVATEDSVPAYRMKKLFAAMHITPALRIRGPYEAMEGVPTNIVIGRDGRVRYAKSGAFDLDQLNAVLVPLLREPVPAT